MNTVNYMYNSGIHEVDYAVCDNSSTEFEKLISDGTKMVFIVSAIDGSAASSAAPLLAKTAKSRDILTVGFITTPLLPGEVVQTIDAIEEMRENTDSLIVINNAQLETFYPDCDMDVNNQRVHDILAMTVKSIFEIITMKGIIHRDFNDIVTTMKDSGMAFVGVGYGSGENRLENAIREALDSPLMLCRDIFNAKRLLFYLSFQKNRNIKVAELEQAMDNLLSRFDTNILFTWGFSNNGIPAVASHDVKFSIIATGFGLSYIKNTN